MEWYWIAVYLLLGLTLALYLYFTKKFSYWKDRGVSYIEPAIPLGNLSFSVQHLKTIIEKFYARKDEGPFFGGYFFGKPIIVPTDLDFIKDVLIKDFSYFHDRGIYYNEEDDPISAHLFAVDGSKWRSLRFKLTPAFTSGKIKFMLPSLVDVSERFNQTLRDIVRTDRVLEMKELLARFTTDIIGTCAFGIECNSLKDPDTEFRKYGRKVLEEPAHGTVGYAFMTEFPRISKILHLRQTSPDVSNFFMRTVRETINFREKNNVKRKDFMELLIELKKSDNDVTNNFDKLTIEDIAAQSYVFFLAGFETSSTTLSYSLYELALNPEVQEKARQEINYVLLKHDGMLTYEAVQEMIYVDQIISESLRKYPPVVALIRKSVKDYHVSHTNRIIEKGISLFIPAYSIHHDPEIYPDPERFDPDRFAPQLVKYRHPMAFLAFGDGPRNCIGMRFGRLQSLVGLIILLKNYRFKPCSKTQIPIVFSKTSPILSPEHGMYLDVENIN